MTGVQTCALPISVAYQLQTLFDVSIVVVGSNMELNQSYIKHKFIDEKEFIQELEKITKVSKDTADKEVGSAVELTLKNMGISLYDSLLIFDEAYKLFDSRTPSDKLVRVFGYFIAQSRHYGASVIIIAPQLDTIDKRIRRQIDWQGRCVTTCYTLNGQCIRPNCPHKTTVRLTGGLETWNLKIGRASCRERV